MRQDQDSSRRQWFQQLEQATHQSSVALSELIDHLAFNADGLIPVITQDAESKTVLMHAWMNKTALLSTLDTGFVTYWSRSRQQLWKKGESSGHFQQLISMAVDCDGDTLLCLVQQTGPACHTGRPNCFYLAVDSQKQTVVVQGNAGQ